VVKRDAPRRIVALAARALPSARADWGAAMVAELDHVDGRGARWRFALGCARVAAFRAPAREMAVAVAAVAALVGYGFVRWPGMVADDVVVGAIHLAVLVLLLAAYLRASVSPAAVGWAGLLVAALWAASDVMRTLSVPGAITMAAVAAVGALAGLALVGARARGVGAGARAGASVGVAIGLGSFLAIVLVTYLATGRLTGDPQIVAEYHATGARDLTTYAVGESLAAAVNGLWIGPAMGALLGALGGLAALGRASR
jgi:hypothetical protein